MMDEHPEARTNQKIVTIVRQAESVSCSFDWLVSPSGGLPVAVRSPMASSSCDDAPQPPASACRGAASASRGAPQPALSATDVLATASSQDFMEVRHIGGSTESIGSPIEQEWLLCELLPALQFVPPPWIIPRVEQTVLAIAASSSRGRLIVLPWWSRHLRASKVRSCHIKNVLLTLLFSTSEVPGTEGRKKKLRQQSEVFIDRPFLQSPQR